MNWLFGLFRRSKQKFFGPNPISSDFSYAKYNYGPIWQYVDVFCDGEYVYNWLEADAINGRVIHHDIKSPVNTFLLTGRVQILFANETCREEFLSLYCSSEDGK